MKLLISVCVFSALLVMSYGVPSQYPLVNEYLVDQQECQSQYPDNRDMALVCTNYLFGILKNDDDDGEPKFNYKRFIALAVENSKYQHNYVDPSVPIQKTSVLLTRSKYCRRVVQSTNLITLQKSAVSCMGFSQATARKLASYKYDLDKSSSEETLDESGAKAASIFLYNN